MAHLLDDQHGGVLLDHLVYRRHDAHVHHDLDDFGGLDCHLLGEFGDRDRLGDRDLAHHPGGRHLEAVLAVGVTEGAPPAIAGFLLLVAIADVTDDMQFLPAVAPALVIDRLGRRLAWLRGRGLALALGDFLGLDLGRSPRLFLGTALAVFLVGALLVLLGDLLQLEALLLAALVLLPLRSGLHGFLGLALAVDLLLLQAHLVLEGLALDVGALGAHLDVDRAGPALGAGELQLGLRLALQRDLVEAGVEALLVIRMTAAQVGQQLMLRLLADHVLGTFNADSRLVQLQKEPVDRHLQHFRELRNRNICHK